MQMNSNMKACHESELVGLVNTNAEYEKELAKKLHAASEKLLSKILAWAQYNSNFLFPLFNDLCLSLLPRLWNWISMRHCLTTRRHRSCRTCRKLFLIISQVRHELRHPRRSTAIDGGPRGEGERGNTQGKHLLVAQSLSTGQHPSRSHKSKERPRAHPGVEGVGSAGQSWNGTWASQSPLPDCKEPCQDHRRSSRQRRWRDWHGLLPSQVSILPARSPLST